MSAAIAMKAFNSQGNKPCVCGKIHECVTQNILIQKNIAPDIVEFIKNNFGGGAKSGIICDGNTYEAARDIIRAVTGAGLGEAVRLEIKSHHADEFMVEDCDKALEGKNFDCFIAVGAGTVHDITRIAAHKRNVRFISCPTAPSVDGFVSTVAPMTTKNGMKITLPAVAPIALFADSGILEKAPERLVASGVGDILGKYIALADWRISNLTTGEYICDRAVELEYFAANNVKNSLLELKKDRDNRKLYESFCAGLLEALVISGLCMQYIGNSRPASGAEHHIAHFFEMGILLSTDCLHGENVGAGSVLCADAYHKFAESANIKFVENYDVEYDLLKKYYGRLYEDIVKENRPNSIRKVTPGVFYGSLVKIKNIISEIPSREEFEELLDINCGVKNLSGVNAYNLKCGKNMIEPLTLRLAPYIRDRITLLKLMRCIEIPAAHS